MVARDPVRAAALMEFHLNAQHEWFIQYFPDV
jgi:hypothetical protein